MGVQVFLILATPNTSTYTNILNCYTVYAEFSAVCKFRGFRGQSQGSKNLIRGNLSVCNNLLNTCFENDDCTLHSKQFRRGYHVYN